MPHLPLLQSDERAEELFKANALVAQSTSNAGPSSDSEGERVSNEKRSSRPPYGEDAGATMLAPLGFSIARSGLCPLYVENATPFAPGGAEIGRPTTAPSTVQLTDVTYASSNTNASGAGEGTGQLPIGAPVTAQSHDETAAPALEPVQLTSSWLASPAEEAGHVVAGPS